MMKSDQAVELKFTTLKDKTIALCVTGSIGACETIKLARELRRYGASVQAYLTPSAEQFITPLSLEWATQQKVVTQLSGSAEHVTNADLILVAPATLHTINKMVLGLADNPVTTTLASGWGQEISIAFVPTMHESLAQNPVLKKNISFLKKEKNIYFIEPKHEESKEKFPECETIVSEVSHVLAQGPLKHKKILITAGPTRGPIDPVRYISNFSTGELGVRLAHELYIRGADPTLVYGSGSVSPHSFYPVISVTTPQEMLDVVLSELQVQKVHAAIFSAAVLDHVPAQTHDLKLSSAEPLEVQFVQTPKIIREIDKVTRHSCENISKGLFKIGFKLEWKKSEEELARLGMKALDAMNIDVVVVNDLSHIKDQIHPALLLDRKGAVQKLQSKKEIIESLIQSLENAL
ncbi:MAG: bifunctional phosphopantothenoylcysteine decarboxylase/phosphopantothenate--cysteine ligase CoaBC [Deltaproteobacteria bacterium]|nr:bifunctional phosphopantothenoylcysteine decarboxylase/phosphopantothenate--cysteine ligase CoaBC [Deltaproteobacteria bacterium]